MSLGLDWSAWRRAELRDFSAIDYAYATTIHKSQGSTVTRSYELFSSFASKELDYVAKSRYRAQHNIYGAEHEFESYQSSVQHRTEKHEASDVGHFDLSVFAPDAESLAKLEKRDSAGAASLEKLKTNQEAARLRHIVQGVLIDVGEDEVDTHGRKLQYATIEVAGSTHSFRGVNLLESFKKSGVNVGDHVGLEARSPEKHALVGGVSWRWHTKDRLAKAGLLRDGQTLAAIANGKVTDPTVGSRLLKELESNGTKKIDLVFTHNANGRLIISASQTPQQ